jgi:hypothetical protein
MGGIGNRLTNQSARTELHYRYGSKNYQSF